ncbi:HNH endonuclease [Nocardioides exalbidus]|uniref:HNH endonuclease n=1 Tax=Nocardioides exalbidus TaxID=402596 RepID=A0A1H4KQU6_9ACTN|nr:HNH endonuclease signature motif containing protein [Nocardioides exalbidus]SEB60485.1 HNH endonuclease [Nocardioides exalbidus]
MPYNIAKSLVNKLPANERNDPEVIGKYLLDEQGGICWLCSGQMHIASEVLEADHDEPEGEGGPTVLANLHLAHLECNRSKRNLSTTQIQPYLRLRRFMRENGGRLKYDGVTTHFDIVPGPSHVELSPTSADISFADKSTTSSQLHRESVGGTDFTFCFVEVPRVALFNDARVQPRNIRYDHAFMIYSDLLKNPLHEPPGCRLDEPDKNGLQRILMFDGQHKTIACWMQGRMTIVIKLYLDMSVSAANYLVNSIQSKIKKLPLSAFELASKMSDEWRNKVDQYESAMADQGKSASEDGFLRWVPSGAERTRAKAAFQSALMQRVLEHSNFRANNFTEASASPSLTEGMIKRQILDKMLSSAPLKDPFYESTSRREEEVENIVWMWNLVLDELATKRDDGTPDEIFIERSRRLFKQASLEHISNLLGQLYGYVMIKGDSKMLDGVPDQTQRDAIEKSIKNICDHPVWTASLDRDGRMLAVQDALTKNQGGKDSFEGVALKLSYALLGQGDTEYGAYWK